MEEHTWRQLLSLMNPTAGEETKEPLQKAGAAPMDSSKCWERWIQTMQPFFGISPWGGGGRTGVNEAMGLLITRGIFLEEQIFP